MQLLVHGCSDENYTIVKALANREASGHGWLTKVQAVATEAVTRPTKPKVAAKT